MNHAGRQIADRPTNTLEPRRQGGRARREPGMKWDRAMGLVVLAVCVQTCDGDCNPDSNDPAPTEQTVSATNRPDGGPEQPADDPSGDTSDRAEAGAFVPMADDLIVRLEYGDAMDGPGWYRVTIADVDDPLGDVCDTMMETSSPDGLSVFGSDDYTCLASVFNANSDDRTDPHEFILSITSSLGYLGEHLLTYEGGSFTNEVGNVITYGVP
jgi:hypothetical protein